MATTTYSKMKFIGFSIFLLFFATKGLFAQHNSHLEEYLEEKVRDPQKRQYIEKLLEGTVTEADYNALKNAKRELKIGSTPNNELLQEGAEPHIVIHPTNKNILALAFMQNSLSSADYPIYTSLNGGDTWAKSSFSTEAALNAAFPGTMLLGGGDPILAFDNDGKLHMSFIYVHGSFPNLKGDMFYVYSVDTGKTFIVPPIDDFVVYPGNIFASDMLDRQWMEVDNSGGPHDGNLYMSAFYFMGPLSTPGQIVLTKSADSSGFNLNNVTTAVVAQSGNITQFGNVKVDQNGRVHVSCAYMYEVDGSGFVYHTISEDGAKTFGAPTQVGTGDLLGPQPGNNPNPVIHDRENAAISLAVDGDNVYMAWSDLGNNESRAYFSFSNNVGVNFSPPYEFGNAFLDSSTYHFMPNVTADSGYVTINWYAIDKFSGITNYYMAESNNKGASFDFFMEVSDTNSAFVGGSNAFYGDYNSSVKHGGTTWSVWSDGRNGKPDIYVVKTRLSENPLAKQPVGIELTPVSEEFQVVSLWPNPVLNDVNLEIRLNKTGHVYAQVFDLQGKRVKDFTPQSLLEGNNRYRLNIADLNSGQYLLKITSDSGLFATRVLLKQ